MGDKPKAGDTLLLPHRVKVHLFSEGMVDINPDRNVSPIPVEHFAPDPNGEPNTWVLTGISSTDDLRRALDDLERRAKAITYTVHEGGGVMGATTASVVADHVIRSGATYTVNGTNDEKAEGTRRVEAEIQRLRAEAAVRSTGK